MAKTLLDKVWDAHTVRRLPTGQTQLFIGLHLVHEVTSPQAFDALRQRGWKVAFRERTFATVDHIVPTGDVSRPFKDTMAEAMMSALERNCRDFDVPLFNIGHASQGIVHVIGPELGLTQPGMTIACGDSHTSTHGAFGAVAFGIGTSQVRDVLASQCLAIARPKVRRIEVNGELAPGVYAKDVILHIIRLHDRPKSATMIANLLNRDDIQNVQYSLRKLLGYQLVSKSRAAKSNVHSYQITDQGRARVRQYAHFRRQGLIGQTNAIRAIDQRLATPPAAVQPLNIAFSDPPTATELSQVQDKINELASALKRP